MAPKSTRKRKKGATDQGELTGGAESLENVSKASEDHRRLLRSKTKPGIQEGVETNVVTTEVAASGDVLPHDHDVCTDAVAEPVPPLLLGDPVQEQATGGLAETAGSPIMEETVPTTEPAPPTEEHTDINVYHTPFTIYQRFIPDTNWNVDSKASTPYDIFPDTGERRKKEVSTPICLVPNVFRLLLF